MGTALAQILALRGHRAALWDYESRTVEVIARTGKNERFLPGVKLSKNIVPEASMERAVENAALVIVACASPYVRQTVRKLAQCLIPSPGLRPPSPRGRGEGEGRRLVIAHVVKGLEAKTNLTMHEVVQSELPAALRRRVVTISGPSIAKELVRGVPTAVVAASQDKKARELVRDVFTSSTFKVAVSADWKGVGICGGLKNVYAIALGMCDGYTRKTTKGYRWSDTKYHEIGLPMNMKAFMFTLAVAEMEQVVVALGGKAITVHGLAGVGDLVVTGLGDGRNRALGERICKEGHCKFVWQKSSQTHEGVAATKVFFDLARRKKVKAPLLNLVCRVLYRGADPCKEIKKFFADTAL